MPFDASGTFWRVMNWTADLAAQIKVRADRHDAEDNNFRDGLSECLTKTGKSLPLADMPWNGKRITNLGAPIQAGDAVSKSYVDAFTASILVADTPPPNPYQGQLWWESDSGNTFLWFNDGTSAQWVQQNTAPAPTDPYGFATADMSWRSKSATEIAVNTKPDGSGSDVAVVSDAGNFTINGSYFSTAGYFIGSTSSTVFGNASGSVGTVYLRPRGWDSTTNQAYVDTNGNLVVAGVVSSPLLGAFAGSSGTVTIGVASGGAGNVVFRPRGYDSAVNQAYVDTNGAFSISQNMHAAGGHYSGHATAAVLGVASGGSGTVHLRPRGYDSGTNQVTIDSNGVIALASTAQGFALSAPTAHGVNVAGYATLAGPVYNSVLAQGNPNYNVISLQTLHQSGVWAGMRIQVAGVNEVFDFRQDGQAYKTSAGGWIAISDARIKTETGEYTRGLEAILALRPITYLLKERYPEPGQEEMTVPWPEGMKALPRAVDKEHIGLIAQEAEIPMPEMVTSAPGLVDGAVVPDLRAIDITPITYALINAVKELTARIEALEAGR